MVREKQLFVCQNCGFESAGWLGRCPGCDQWNTFQVETTVRKKTGSDRATGRVILLDQVDNQGEERLLSGWEEFDRVLGGGIVSGSVVLIGGDPGIGKSTLLLQLGGALSQRGPVLYVSGEESASQVKIRAARLGVGGSQLYFLAEVNLASIEEAIRSLSPVMVVIDSIQTMYRDDIDVAAGSVTQVRECTAQLTRLAKTERTPVFIIGHVTKEGHLAGPRVLEHMVDTVLYFEGERHQSFRLLRAVKNRFGATDEIGVFDMQDRGLIEVRNPSELFLAERPETAPGSCVVPSIEGTRPLLVEIQALVSPSALGSPRRMATGIDYNRTSMIVAVLEKRAGLRLGQCDVYINVVGGVKLNEPAADLGTAVALASSFYDLPVPSDTVFVGEIGLTGEIRSVGQMEQRVKEAARLGFRRCLVPSGSTRACRGLTVELLGVPTLGKALDIALGGNRERGKTG